MAIFILCLHVSSSCPGLLRIKTVVIGSVWLFYCVFGKTRSAINRFARGGLERDRGGLAAVGTFDLEHGSFHLTITSNPF
jgi:hypothetical protein